jgi:uncharacterized repeat protein (TIGR03803 family)
VKLRISVMQASSYLFGMGLVEAFAAAIPIADAAAAPPTLTTLYSFGSTTSDGEFPAAGVISDASGALYGTTEEGGSRTICTSGCGTVFVLIPSSKKGRTWTEAVLHSFDVSGGDGILPTAGLIMDSAGAFYGTTEAGGTSTSPAGTVFKLTPQAGGTYTERVLYTFTSATADGAYPQAPLIMDATGALYGTTTEGGITTCPSPGCGTVFKLTPAADGSYAESVLHSFASAPVDGATPHAGLIMDSTGALYGTTAEGGGGTNCFGCGTVFKLTPATDGSYTESVLYSFTGGPADGVFPVAGLIMDATGALYGTTPHGGSTNCSPGCGTVFKLTPAAGAAYTESVLYSFKGGTDGAEPEAGLIMDAGVLYGTTYYGGGTSCQAGAGCGTVFSLIPSGGGKYKEQILYSFTGGADGANPMAPLYSPAKGVFFGTTLGGGTMGEGTVFKLTVK